VREKRGDIHPLPFAAPAPGRYCSQPRRERESLGGERVCGRPPVPIDYRA
jgi:hypothetical protein